MDEAQLKEELELKKQQAELDRLELQKEQERLKLEKQREDYESEAEEKREERERESEKKREKEGFLAERLLRQSRQKVGRGISWALDKLMLVMIIVLIFGAVFAGYSAYQWPAVREGIALQWDKLTAGFSSGTRVYTNYLEKLDKEAKGEYASGVQETSTKDLGLKIKELNTYAPDNKFTKGQDYIIGGELTAQLSPDQELNDTLNVSVSCKTREDKLNGTAEPSTVSLGDVSSIGQGFICKLPSNTKTGSQYADVYAIFPFTTKAVKFFGMFDKDTFQQMSEAQRDKYTEIKATYSGGPAQIGIDLMSYPLTVSSQCSVTDPKTDCLPRIQITIDRKGLDPESSGKFEKIKNLQIQLFDGIKLRACTQVKFTNEGNNIWTADPADLAKIGNIEEAFTMGCQLQIEDPNLLVPDKALPAVNQIGVIVDYDFQIKRSLQITIRETTQQLPGTGEIPETVAITGVPLRVYEKYKTTIDSAASTYGIRKALLIGLISQESQGNQNAVSSVGAAGLMQLMPSTATDLGLKVTSVIDRCIITEKSGCDYVGDERFNPEKSINAGAKYLKQLIDKYHDESLALAAYNWGMGHVDDNCQTATPGIKSCTLPPETQKYVPSVLAYAQEFEQETTTIAIG